MSTPSTPSGCQFHLHKHLNSSELLFACATLSEVLRAVGAPPAAGDSAAAPRVASPSALSPGASLSMTASAAPFGPTTCCHLLDRLSPRAADAIWPRWVAAAARRVLSPFRRRMGAVSGVFVRRRADGDVAVGLITRAPSRDGRTRDALRAFFGDAPATRCDARLPICAARRGEAALRMWWEPRTERVTPRRAMPPIRVILEERRGAGDGAYNTAEVFLCRPAAARLRGVTRKPVHSAKPRRGRPHEEREKAEERRRVVLSFEDLSVEEEGEHLVGVEVEPRPSYRPFLPTLYAHLAPFLVVDKEDA